MAGMLLVVGFLVMLGMFRIARAGRQLHHEFAHKAAAVDGEMADVLGNMALVASFDGLRREHRRFDAALGREMMAPAAQPLLPGAPAAHARTRHRRADVRLLAWAFMLWDQGKATVGDVVLVSTLGFVASARDARSRRRSRRRDPAHRAVVGGADDAARPARPAGPPAGAAVAAGQHRRRLLQGAFRLSRWAPGVRRLRSQHPCRRAHRPHRHLGQRQVHTHCPPAALLRRAGRPHHDRRGGYFPRHPAQSAQADRGRAAGHRACSTARCARTSATATPSPPTRGEGGRRRCALRGFHRRAAATAGTRSSATVASTCRAASASALQSPAPS